MSPLTTEITLRVPYQDCDMHQVVRAAAYLRYMQEAAFAGSAAAGYTNERYQAMQRVWLIRENQIEFLTPLRYGDALRMVTWVADFRRVRSLRAYEFWAHSEAGYASQPDRDERLVARGHTDWVFIDQTSGLPAPVPDEMIAAFLPPGETAGRGLERSRFPAPNMAAAPFNRQRSVQWRDLDSVGHVNNAAYLDYTEDAAYQLVAAAGWPPEKMAAARLALAPRRLRIEYRQPAWFADAITVQAQIARPAAGEFECLASVLRSNDDELLAHTATVWGCVASDTRLAQPLPAELAAALNALAP